MPPTRTQRAGAIKKVVFTWYPEQADEEVMTTTAEATYGDAWWADRAATFKCLVMQLEKCPETGRIHMQGACWLNSRKRYNQIQDMLGMPGAHIEQMEARWSDNVRYCTKEGGIAGPWEYGEPPKEGKASLMRRFYAMQKEGMSRAAMIDEEPSLLLHEKAFDFYTKTRTFSAVREWRDVEVQVLIGKPGVGKSRTAFRENGGAFKCYRVHKMNKGSLWWDGYGQPGPNGEDNSRVIVIDDFDSGWSVEYRALLALLDGHPLRLPVKGSFVYANWDKVVITTNVPIKHWYPDEPDIEALLRRINKIRKWGPNGEMVEPGARAGMGHPADRVVAGPSGTSGGTGTGTGGNTNPRPVLTRQNAMIYIASSDDDDPIQDAQSSEASWVVPDSISMSSSDDDE